MTPHLRRALNLASRKGGATIIRARVAPDRQITNATTNRLIAEGWATRHHDTALITAAGRAALNAPVAEDPPVYLRLRDGLTHRTTNAVLGESPEVLDPATLKPYWAEQAARRRAEAEDRRAAARRRSKTIREAA